MIHYFEEEAVKSYTEYLAMIENKQLEDIPAPKLARDYYNLPNNAKLSDMIKCVRDDERKHSKVNKKFSNVV